MEHIRHCLGSRPDRRGCVILDIGTAIITCVHDLEKKPFSDLLLGQAVPFSQGSTLPSESGISNAPKKLQCIPAVQMICSLPDGQDWGWSGFYRCI